MTALRLVRPVQRAVSARLILTEYSGAHGDRAARSASLEGAIRAALIRLVHGEYSKATVYDERFGHKSKALVIEAHRAGVSIKWSHTPRWVQA